MNQRKNTRLKRYKAAREYTMTTDGKRISKSMSKYMFDREMKRISTEDYKYHSSELTMIMEDGTRAVPMSDGEVNEMLRELGSRTAKNDQ